MYRNRCAHGRERRGAILVLAAFCMIVLMAMVTFAVDVGYVSMVRSELQRTADATALAAAGHLFDKDALRGAPNYFWEVYKARNEADQYALSNVVAKSGMYLPPGLSGDFTVGTLESTSYPVHVEPDWHSPNAVKVILRRDDVANGPIALFFGPLLGRPTQDVTAQAIAYYATGIKGFKGTANTPNPQILPYTMLVDDWDAIMANPSQGTDQFKYDSVNRIVSRGSDSIPELKLFPLTSGKKGGVTPGNFGTIDIGNPNNSTSDLARQILEGPNAYDMSFFPDNTLQLGNDGTVTLNGDTGISAGVKDELAAIIGQPRVLPLYSTVGGNGNNANFVIVRFVGITIVDVQLTGSLSSKYIMVQPTYVIDPTAVSGGQDGVTSRFVRRPLSLIE